VHVPIITACFVLLANVIPIGVVVLVGALLSLLAAQLAYTAVELNAHKLGKYLGSAVVMKKEDNQLASADRPEVPQTSMDSLEEGVVAERPERPLIQHW
jgi:peptidoglycan/LPS O-acetylase OafA/YrhL